jgi:hypothetical protein
MKNPSPRRPVEMPLQVLGENQQIPSRRLTELWRTNTLRKGFVVLVVGPSVDLTEYDIMARYREDVRGAE